MKHPTIKDKILQESGQRREKRFRLLLTDEEYSKLLFQSIEDDMTMSELIRHKLFGKDA